MAELPEHEIQSAFYERTARINIRVKDLPDLEATSSSRPRFSPDLVNLRFSQDGAGAPVILDYVAVRGPRRLKGGGLSENTTHDIHEYLDVPLEGFESFDALPEWVVPLVRKHWPADL